MKSKVTNNDNKEVKNLLVVGDWVVDENWITGIHRSATASRTGQTHYRSLHPFQAIIECFCAAGQTASILENAQIDDKHPFKVYGIGIWHEQDTTHLENMLHQPSNNKLYTITKVPSNGNKDNPKDKRLFTLARVLDPNGTRYGTTKVIRIYQNTGSKVQLIQRVDWELQIPANHDSPPLDKSKFEQIFKDISFHAVIIKDICKGTITSTLIEMLSKRFSNIPWYISTKAWKPDWFKFLKEVNVKILMIPEVAAQRAIRDGDMSCWITRAGSASANALEQFNLIKEYLKPDIKPLVVCLPNGSQVLARDYSDPAQQGLIQKEVNLQSFAVEVQFASVFFPAIISLMENNAKSISTFGILQRALSFTNLWMKLESERISDAASGGISKEQHIQLAQADYLTIGKWSTFPWEKEKRAWEEALNSYGIIKEVSATDGASGRLKLELWRSMTEVDGYVACIKNKREILQKLVSELSSFKKEKRRQHKSFMLIASPGAGKTFLVKSLAKSMGFRYLSFNITQMLSKNDILDSFDTVVTTQAYSKDEPFLVFIDEINAELGSQHVYDTFLAPLDEGIYVRAGKAFPIEPCVWLFAGTEKPVASEAKGIVDKGRDKSSKASDFESRLSVPPLNIKMDEKIQTVPKEVRIEKVYLGVTIIRLLFPDVRRISEKVLHLFHHLNPALEIRELTHFVKSFKDIQYGQVTSNNIYLPWLTEQKIDVDAWLAEDEGDLVEIE